MSDHEAHDAAEVRGRVVVPVEARAKVHDPVGPLVKVHAHKFVIGQQVDVVEDDARRSPCHRLVVAYIEQRAAVELERIPLLDDDDSQVRWSSLAYMPLEYLAVLRSVTIGHDKYCIITWTTWTSFLSSHYSIR